MEAPVPTENLRVLVAEVKSRKMKEEKLKKSPLPILTNSNHYPSLIDLEIPLFYNVGDGLDLVLPPFPPLLPPLPPLEPTSEETWGRTQEKSTFLHCNTPSSGHWVPKAHTYQYWPFSSSDLYH